MVCAGACVQLRLVAKTPEIKEQWVAGCNAILESHASPEEAGGDGGSQSPVGRRPDVRGHPSFLFSIKAVA